MLLRQIKNDRGDMHFFSIFFVLSIVILMAFVLLFSTVKINTINIRNGIKMELNNLSAQIYADTFRSQREANLHAYEQGVNVDTSYLNRLQVSFIRELKKKIDIDNEDYRLYNMSIQIRKEGENIKYTFTCRADFYIHMFSQTIPIAQDIRLSGSHHTKY